MKKQILDTPFLETHKFKYAFEDILKPNEEIIWEGKPIANKLFSFLDLLLLMFVIFYFIFPQFFSENFIIYIGLGAFHYLMYFGYKSYINLKIQSLNYAITSERILWSSNYYSDRQTHSIDLRNIKWVEIEDDAIFIRPNNYDLVTFETQSAKDLTVRKKPTLENIENMREVYDLIEKYINENNTK